MSTRNVFSEELSQLRHDILAMSIRVEENLSKAISALRTRDANLAKEVRADDLAIDIQRLQIEDNAATIIATQQPVARDLRELVSVYKITGNIERVGDHAVHLARAAKKLAKRGESSFHEQEHLEKMAEIGRIMLHSAMSAFMSMDMDAARETAAMDAKIDAEYEDITEDVLNMIKKKSAPVKEALQILHTSNQLERLGDHISNICEIIIYIIEGKHEELNE